MLFNNILAIFQKPFDSDIKLVDFIDKNENMHVFLRVSRVAGLDFAAFPQSRYGEKKEWRI